MGARVSSGFDSSCRRSGMERAREEEYFFYYLHPPPGFPVALLTRATREYHKHTTQRPRTERSHVSGVRSRSTVARDKKKNLFDRSWKKNTRKTKKKPELFVFFFCFFFIIPFPVSSAGSTDVPYGIRRGLMRRTGACTRTFDDDFFKF